jgi:hypothetical protein
VPDLRRAAHGVHDVPADGREPTAATRRPDADRARARATGHGDRRRGESAVLDGRLPTRRRAGTHAAPMTNRAALAVALTALALLELWAFWRLTH